MSLLSVGNYHIALYFSRSLRLEIVALRIFLKEAETSIYPRLRCEGVSNEYIEMSAMNGCMCLFDLCFLGSTEHVVATWTVGHVMYVCGIGAGDCQFIRGHYQDWHIGHGCNTTSVHKA